MQDFAEKLKSFAGQAGDSIGKQLGELKDNATQASDYFQSNPTMRKGLDALKDTASQAGDQLQANPYISDVLNFIKDKASQAGDYIQNDATPALGKGLEFLKDKSSQAGDYLQANPTIAAMLMAGGGAGLLSGYLTSQQEEEESESKMQRRGRILRNALLAAAAGAGTVGLGAAGYNSLAEATPAGSVNPVQEKLTSPYARALGGIGLGGLGFVKGMGLDDVDMAQKARSFLSPADQLAVKGMKPSEVITFASHPTKGFPARPSGFGNPIAGHFDFLDRAADKVLAARRGSPLLDKALKALVGSSRAGQLARVGGAAGLLLPEAISGAANLVLQD